MKILKRLDQWAVTITHFNELNSPSMWTELRWITAPSAHDAITICNIRENLRSYPGFPRVTDIRWVEEPEKT